MVSGSGLPPGLALKAHIFLVAAAAASATGCVYFNSVYNANALFERGRREIEHGNEAAGRATLDESIEKAERVVENKPNSRWADDAQRLIAYARVLREEWPEAAEASVKLLEMVHSARDSAEAAGFLGMAEVRLGNSAQADSLLTAALEEDWNERLHASLFYSRGLARIGLGQLSSADDDFRASSAIDREWVAPRLARARELVMAGRYQEAGFELTQVFKLTLERDEEDELYQAVQHVAAADPEVGRVALLKVEVAGLSVGMTARFVKLRGDLDVDVGRIVDAERDYRLAAEIAPQSRTAVDAYLALVDLKLARAITLADLEDAYAVLRDARQLNFGTRVATVAELIELIRRLEYFVERGKVGYLAAAEVAWEDLESLGLARHLYLTYVEEQPDGLWAPKALLAALDLMDLDSSGTNGTSSMEPPAEELRRQLLENYWSSAYVQALVGEAKAEGFTYEELEQGLRQQLNSLRIQADRVLSDPRRASNRP